MTRFPIKLEDKHTRRGTDRGTLIEASLYVDIPANDIVNGVHRWMALWEAGLDRRRRLKLAPLENEHWDWAMKVDWLALAEYRSLAVECEGAIQGLMLVVTDGHHARLAPDIGKSLLYIDYVQTAPWNSDELVDKPRFGAVGSHLLDGAIALSLATPCAGRVGLHSLQRSEGFYERMGLARVEVEEEDQHAKGLWYFELSRQRALEWMEQRSNS